MTMRKNRRKPALRQQPYDPAACALCTRHRGDVAESVLREAAADHLPGEELLYAYLRAFHRADHPSALSSLARGGGDG